MESSDLKNLIVIPGPTYLLLYILCVGLLDTGLRIGLKGIENFSVHLLFVHALLFSLFFGVVLTLLKSISYKEKIPKIIKDIGMYFWIIGLTPIFSYIIYGEVPESILSSGVVSILLVVIVLTFTLNLKVSSKMKISNSILFSSGMIAVSIPIFMINRVSLANGVQPYFKLYELFKTDILLQSGWSMGLLINHRYHLLIVFLLLENLLIYALFAKKFLSRRFTNMLKSIKPFRTLHFVMIVVLGVIFVQNTATGEALSIFSVNHFPFIFLPALCLILLWQFTTLLNDIYDLDIDVHVHPDRPLVSGDFDHRFYMDILIFISLLSSLLSMILGLPLLLLNFAALMLAVLYSVPPFRLRDRVYGHICVGLGSLIGFLFGVYSPIAWRHGIYLASGTIKRDIPFFPETFLVGMLIVIVLSISPLINALSDYEGDKKTGVRNVYTVLGFERGKKLVSFLIILLFISPLLLFNSILDIIFMLLAGVISSIIFYRFEDHRPVFGLYFLVLVYLLLRFTSYI